MEKLLEQLNIIEFETEEALANSLLGEYYKNDHIIDQLENEYTDITYTSDESLESLIENLSYNGFTNEQILTMNNAHYGNVIDIYKIKDDPFFILGIGAR